MDIQLNSYLQTKKLLRKYKLKKIKELLLIICKGKKSNYSNITTKIP